jgi:hypothetical protein
MRHSPKPSMIHGGSTGDAGRSASSPRGHIDTRPRSDALWARCIGRTPGSAPPAACSAFCVHPTRVRRRRESTVRPRIHRRRRRRPRGHRRSQCHRRLCWPLALDLRGGMLLQACQPEPSALQTTPAALDLEACESATTEGLRLPGISAHQGFRFLLQPYLDRLSPAVLGVTPVGNTCHFSIQNATRCVRGLVDAE